jgi:twinkle protein
MRDTNSFLRHEECQCGSSDGRAVYGDPDTQEIHHKFCFVCGATFWPDDREAVKEVNWMAGDFIQHKATDLGVRRISRATCARAGYGVGESNGQPVQVADYCDDTGALVAQKVRYPDKKFEIRGNAQAMGLWQAHRFRNDRGRVLTICEGEIDTLAMDQTLGGKRPCVSLPNGAQSAKRVVAKNIEMLETYESVIFFFDADAPGREAAVECAALLTPGKAKIAIPPNGCKDIGEAVEKGLYEELTNAWWEAKTYRPDGILTTEDLQDLLTNEVEVPSVTWPYPKIQGLLRGCREGEITVISSGTGMGKSQLCRGLAYHMVSEEAKVGYIGLEECAVQTALGLLGQALDKPLHLDRCGYTPEQLAEEIDKHFKDRLVVLRHDPSSKIASLLSRIKYMRVSEGCRFVILDHLHMLISNAPEGGERQFIDSTMAQLRALVESTGIGIILVSHLRKSQGQAHEESGTISISDLRGSGSIAHYANSVVFLEAPDRENEPNLRRLRVGQNRFSGQISAADSLRYDEATGKLNAVEPMFESMPLEEVPF